MFHSLIDSVLKQIYFEPNLLDLSDVNNATCKNFLNAGFPAGNCFTFASTMRYFFLKYINNRYFYTVLAFIIWMAFFDSDNFREQMRLSNKIERLQQQKHFYQTEIQKNKSALNALKYDTTQLEKYAREKYFMKKDNEDIYVIIRPSKH
jgi:cell division protein FtsB